MMDKIFVNKIGQGVEVQTDDIVIYEKEFKLSGEKQMIHVKRKEEILDYLRPTDKKGLRRLLGMMNF